MRTLSALLRIEGGKWSNPQGRCLTHKFMLVQYVSGRWQKNVLFYIISIGVSTSGLEE